MSLRTRVCALALTFVVASLVASCDRRGRIEYPICDVNEAGINDSTIGPLHIDELLPALRVRCPAVGDTMVDALAGGSIALEPALRLIVVGAPVIIRHDGKKVTALQVESPFFRTNDSLGPGTSVARFRNLRGIRVRSAGEAPYGVLLDRRRCGVTYELSGWGSAPPLPDDPPVRGAALARWPDSIVVRTVIVSGCRGNTRDLGVDSVSEAFADSVDFAAWADSSALAADSAALRPVPSALPVPPSLPDAGTSRTDAVPTSAPPATPAELSDLRKSLHLPVQGITRAQLRDTYAEARAGRAHDALDIPAARGTPVLSATSGRVLRLFNSKAGGLMVYATDASERFILLYGHLDRYADGLADGKQLERGQVIGYVGTTGNAPIGTPHLHFAILRGQPNVSWWAGAPVNPYPLLVAARR